MKEILLPAIFSVCASLGIIKSQCNTGLGAINGGHEVRQDLWYTGVESTPDGIPDPSCYKPVAIARYQMYDGKWGTSYACRERPGNDRISADEVNAITKAIERLNANHRKTLNQHEVALELKRLAAVLSNQNTGE